MYLSGHILYTKVSNILHKWNEPTIYTPGSDSRVKILIQDIADSI